MKLVNQAFMFLSLISFGLSSLEAKSLEFFLDHAPQATLTLQADISNWIEEHSSGKEHSCDRVITLPIHCRELKLENIGSQPVKNCFPRANEYPCMCLDELASALAKEEYPLLALYHWWERSILKDRTADDADASPLDLINFKGVCSAKTFHRLFIKLCNAIGIETRIARVHGPSVCDFYVDETWNFLDVRHDRLYLALDNAKLVSSEEIMDDPFLLLRAKQDRTAREVNFKEAWKQLAHFEILEPASARSIALFSEDSEKRVEGVDLYPNETLIFSSTSHTSGFSSKADVPLYGIEHALNLETRQSPLLLHYSAPFPIRELKNNTSTEVVLIGKQVRLKPGERFIFKDGAVFRTALEFLSPPKGFIMVSGWCTPAFFPTLVQGENNISLGTQNNPSIIRFCYEIDEEPKKSLVLVPRVLNNEDCFRYCIPYFQLEESSKDTWQKIWWQISPVADFQLVPSNFDQIQPFASTITLPLISDTFLNPSTPYYFRIKGYHNGKWSDWSLPFSFSVEKPAAVEETEFEQIDGETYELNWERCAEDSQEPIDYLVFGSNALDFIPSIYCDKQVNAVTDGVVSEEEINDNLIAIVSEPKIRIKGGLAYYRIIARQCGHYSVPSKLIRIYDQELVQPRNVLQLAEIDALSVIAKRTLFPPSYPGSEISLPPISKKKSRKNRLLSFQTLLRTSASLSSAKYPYELPDVPNEVWNEVRPYLLPGNHPAWPRLNRIFCQSRATQNSETFKRAGFKRWRPGRWSRVSASSHLDLQEYFIKAYCDCETGIIYDWKKWIHRIRGAETIRDCIKKYHLHSHFKVPHKWLYPLPKNPSPPRTSQYVRKNFILVAENMRIEEHEKNEKLYRHMNHQMMEGLYTIMQVCGLYDSVYCFNVPFCKDGKIAVIDTEYHHKWPVPYHKLTHSFSKESRSYWETLTHHGGRISDGVNEPNPPRMDRRDVRE